MKRLRLFSLTLALALVLSSLLGVGGSLAITGSKHYQTGIHDYWTYVHTSLTSVIPVPNTRSYHYYGTENVLNSPAYSTTMWANSSLNQYDGLFEDQANDLGVYNSRSHSISNGQPWTIASTKATGYYSLGIYWPGSSVTYTIWEYEEDEWGVIFNVNITNYAPDHVDPRLVKAYGVS